MSLRACLLTFALTGVSLLPVRAQEGDVVFRSDVSLVRVDAQVLDRNNRTIAGLRADDFILREEGQRQEIRNFTRENMPVDVLLLLDVSASMRPHVERIGAAAHEALRVLGENDRVAIMVFDRSTRLRLPFRRSKGDVEREFELLLSQVSFNGGTDITRALLDAAKYVGREGRRDARRAIVILTDDETERNRDEAAVSRALTIADAVLSALLAPYEPPHHAGSHGTGRGGPWGGGGSPWPGGGPMGGPLGGIILGRRGPYGGGGGNGPVVIGSHTQSAGTAEIAQRSGGDSMPVDDAAALETTLARIRQRYGLYFYLPQGVKPGEERAIEAELAQAAHQRYPDAEVRYRRVYMVPGEPGNTGNDTTDPVMVTRGPGLKQRPVTEPAQGGPQTDATASASGSSAQAQTPAGGEGGWRRQTDGSTDKATSSDSSTADEQSGHGGWRRARPDELQQK